MIDIKQRSKVLSGAAGLPPVPPVFGQNWALGVKMSRRSPFAQCGKTFPYGPSGEGLRCESSRFGYEGPCITAINSYSSRVCLTSVTSAAGKAVWQPDCELY